MEKSLEKYLVEGANAEKGELPLDNPYRDIGFDGGKERLGWVKTLPFSQIKVSLESAVPLFEGKENFIFVGMGGSINGIKPLIALFREKTFYTLDSLDPKAIAEVVDRIESLEKTMVIAISKSGTTKETQLLSLALREIFSNRLGKDSWISNFLWVSDPDSFEKLDSLGWKGANKVPIQFDQASDIGGRFAAPHTLIFFLPMFLLLNEDFSKLKDCYDSFVKLKSKIHEKAYLASCDCKGRKDAYFSPVIDGELNESFSSWVVQLFQESLGSKLKDLPVKTLTNIVEDEMFFPLELGLKIDNPLVSLISQMYFFQVFIAYYSAQRKINFVSQGFVEKYKQQMRMLEDKGQKAASGKEVNLEEAISQVKKLIRPEYRFLEVVLYFYPKPETKESIRKAFSLSLPESRVLVFIGSDWNHQSYQAAFGSKDTFYLLLTASSYEFALADVSKATLAKNIETLKVIAEATHLTIKDKSLLLSFQA